MAFACGLTIVILHSQIYLFLGFRKFLDPGLRGYRVGPGLISIQHPNEKDLVLTPFVQLRISHEVRGLACLLQDLRQVGQ